MVEDESHNIVLKHVAAMQAELNAHGNGGVSSSASQMQGKVVQNQTMSRGGQRGSKTSKKKASTIATGTVYTTPALQSGILKKTIRLYFEEI